MEASARIRTATTPVVVEVQAVPPSEKAGTLPEEQKPAAPEKAGKLPEWVNFTAAVTGITIFAFATSSFYVFGLAFALKEPLSIYFSPADYLRITPSWAIPTLGISALIVLFYALVLAPLGEMAKGARTLYWQLKLDEFWGWPRKLLKRSRVAFWLAVLAPVPFLRLLSLVPGNTKNMPGRTFLLFYCSFYTTWLSALVLYRPPQL
jgi:hypothetical protein